MAFVKLVVVKTQFEGNKDECGKTKINCCSKVNRGININDKNNITTNDNSDAIKTNDNSDFPSCSFFLQFVHNLQEVDRFK